MRRARQGTWVVAAGVPLSVFRKKITKPLFWRSERGEIHDPPRVWPAGTNVTERAA
jgi:hypothetical protein